MYRMKKVLGLLVIGLLTAGCVTQKVAPDPSILRVGVSPNSRPLIFKAGKNISGIEADFATLLGKELGRSVVFVEGPWAKQIEMLEQDQTDIIMSGMTVTSARQMRVNFATPYMQSGMSALFRRATALPGGWNANVVMNQNKRIGFVADTTGAIFVNQKFPKATKLQFNDAEAAVNALKSGKLDMFIHDAPMVWFLYSMNEADLLSFPEVLNVEPLAWGVRKGNTELLDQVNAAVARWQQDGTSQKVINQWLPSF